MTQRTIATAVALPLFLSACATRPRPQELPQDPQTRLPPTVVTARKIEESPRDVPQSVTSVSGRQLRDAGVDNVRDAARYVPNTLITEFTSRRLSFPFVRGVGAGQGEPAVTTFVDGVPSLTVSNTNLPLLGVARVEFLRGPHGALYGRNTIGGAIHVVTERPGDAPMAESEATIGSFGLQEYRLSTSAPVIDDRLSMSLAAVHSQRDGYSENDFTRNDVDSRDSWFGRSQIVWTPDDDDELRLTLQGETALDGSFALSDLRGLRGRPNRINQDFEGSVDRDAGSAALTWTRHGERTELTSITSVSGWDVTEGTDFDFSPIDGVRRFTEEDQTYLWQELRLASAKDAPIELGEDAELGWLVGVSGFWSDSDRAAANEFRPGGAGILFPPGQVGTDLASGAFEDWSAAAFGQLTLTFCERWELAGALRYDYEGKDAAIDRTFEQAGFIVPISSVRTSANFAEWLPRASLSYRWSRAVTSYVLAARGFKAGGFNLTAPAGAVAFGTETSWTYEAGVKTAWLDDRLEVNAAIFHIDWDDMQLSQFDATTGGYVTNAGDATSQGIEIEATGKPCEPLALFAGGGLLDTEFDRFVDQFGVDVSGRDLPFAPDATANTGAQWSQEVRKDLTVFARAEAFWVGRFFYDAANRESERYELVNFRVGCAGKRWRLEGWIRNAFEENWVPVALQANPADPTFFVGESAAPRTFGVTLRVTF